MTNPEPRRPEPSAGTLDRLRDFARQLISDQLAARVGASDIVMSVLLSLYEHSRNRKAWGVREDELERILLHRVRCHVADRAEAETAQIRDVRREVRADAGQPTSASSAELDPADAAYLNEVKEWVRARLATESATYVQVLDLYIQGVEKSDIAWRVKRSVRTVDRALETAVEYFHQALNLPDAGSGG